MREISLHILDIVQNSVAAGAARIEIVVTADSSKDTLSILIKDNGKGMSPEILADVFDPFTTTRTTRKVGLGLPMLAAAAELCDGGVNISSVPGKGTEVDACFKLSHIDRAPFGDIESTIINLIAANPNIYFRYEQIVDGKSFFLDMAEVQRELGEVPVNTVPVINWLKGYFNQGIAQIGQIP
jgi:hypothetical protein